MYSGLLLLLFFLKFGISAIPFAHGRLFNAYYDDRPQWETRFEGPYTIAVPDDADIRVIGANIMHDMGLSGSFGAWRQNKNRISVNIFSFRRSIRMIYRIDEHKIIVEDKLFRWDHFLHKFHWIGGYHQNRLIHDFWALMIDLVCLAVLVWIITGLYMWWQVPASRTPGMIALALGWGTFILFVIML
jgi:hypothetical protein